MALGLRQVGRRSGDGRIDTGRSRTTLGEKSMKMDQPGLVSPPSSPPQDSGISLFEFLKSDEWVGAGMAFPVEIVDFEGTIVWTNAAAARLFGGEVGVLIGRDHDELVCHSPKHDAAAYIGLAGVIEGKPITAVGARFRRLDGRIVRLDYVFSPIGSRGVVVGGIFIYRAERAEQAAKVGRPADDAASRSVFESGPDGAYKANSDGCLVSADRSLAGILGYASPEELLANVTNIREQLYVEPTKHAEFMTILREKGEVARFESQMFRRDRTMTWVSESARLVAKKSGAPLQYESSVLDITWRKLAEEVLLQAEEKWRALVESSSECIIIADADGTVYFANSNAQKYALGLPGENVFRGFSHASQQTLQLAIDRAFRTLQPESLDLERSVSKAMSSWFAVRVVPIERAGGVERVILVATEITAKRLAEEAVRDSQRFIGRVADASPAMLYVYDVLNGRYIYVNHQVQKILGYTAEAFLSGGKPLADELVHPDDTGLLLERKKRLAVADDDGVVFECIFRMRDSTGQWLWIRTRDVVFTRGANGRPEQIIGMAEDVTERRRASQDLEHSRGQLRALSARLQEAREEERAAISRRVHDELGQALTALNWEIAWLQDRVGAMAHGQQAEFTEKMRGMSSMVDAMMQTVRKVSAELRPPILDHFGLIAAIEWQAHEFQARYNIACEILARKKMDAPNRDVSTAVFRIFQEILTNIARHASATKVRVQLNENPAGLALIVSDNGRGITEGQKTHSLGILGMSERAHLFGGRVEISGQAGKGTTVTVLIPRASIVHSAAPRKETLRRSR